MTITNENKRIEHSGTGSVFSFAFNWRIIDEDDLLVILRSVAGVETVQTITTNYAVSGVGDEAGGTVTFVTAPGATDTVHIILDPPLVQETDYSSGGAFPAASHETALDKLTNISKRNRDLVDRAISLTDASTPGSGEYDADDQKIINLADPTEDQDAATKAYVSSSIAAAVLDPTTPVSAFGATLIDDANATAARTTLGAGATGANVFTAVTGQSAMQAMGMAAPIASLLDTANTLDELVYFQGILQRISYENVVVNGDFKVWQTGTTRTNATSPLNSNDIYFADQWYLLSDGADRVEIANTSAAFDIPTGCYGISEFSAVSATNKFAFIHPIESSKTIPLRSKEVTVSFFGAGNAALLGFRCHLVSWSQTADQITSSFISAWSASTTKPTTIANVALVDATNSSNGATSVFNVPNSSTMSQYFFTFTVPANANNLGIFIATNDSGYAPGDRIAFTGFQLFVTNEAVDTVVPFHSRPMAAEIAECERFFQKTFPLATNPVQNSGSLAGALHAQMNAQASGNPRAGIQWQFRSRMLAAPTITTYDPTAAASTWDQVAGATALAATVLNAGECGVFIYSATNAADVSQYAIHATADARL